MVGGGGVLGFEGGGGGSVHLWSQKGVRNLCLQSPGPQQRWTEKTV